MEYQLLTCDIPTIELNGSTNIDQPIYKWTGSGIIGSSTNASVVVNRAGTFTLTVTNSKNGCSAKDQTLVLIDTVHPEISFGPTVVLTCKIPSQNLQASSTASPVQYQWTGPQILSGDKTPTPLVQQKGFYVLELKNTSNGCISVDSTFVEVDFVLPQANAGKDQTLNCNATTIELSGQTNIANPSFHWSGPQTNVQSQTVSIQLPGTYTLTFTNEINGCQKSDEVIISQDTISPIIHLLDIDTITCSQQTAKISISTDVKNPLYTWSGDGIITSNDQPSITVNKNGTFYITVSNKDNGCLSQQDFTVTIDTISPLYEVAELVHILCRQDTASLQVKIIRPAESFIWKGPFNYTQEQNITPIIQRPGIYTLTAIGANGCIVSYNTQVIKDTVYDITAEIIATPCPEIAKGAIYPTIHGGYPPYQYLWSNQHKEKDLTHVFDGTYTITVTDSLGCQVSTSFEVPEGKFTIETFENASIEFGEEVQLFTTSNKPLEDLTYRWTPEDYVSCNNCPDPIVTPIQNTTFELIATDTAGCTAIDQVHIQVKTMFSTYFPNAFSPNKDGVNDVFRALGDLHQVKKYKLYIFDRWNNKVFETSDVYSGWDGKKGNQLSPLDVYTYYAEIEYFSGYRQEKKGYITLIE